ncbi:MAG: hypothetical protein AAF488_08095 [Planctomycetota bacterium]
MAIGRGEASGGFSKVYDLSLRGASSISADAGWMVWILMKANRPSVGIHELRDLDPLAALSYAVRCSARVRSSLDGALPARGLGGFDVIAEVDAALESARARTVGERADPPPSIRPMQEACGRLGGRETIAGNIALSVYLTLLASRAVDRGDPVADLVFSAEQFAWAATVDAKREEFGAACRRDYDRYLQLGDDWAQVDADPLW